ncbi:hypothetical protein PLICRDRAFT_52878 [Plicaturopsis crispa FD-325 SS-3]|nr:hypothetical protein PLICRDRAFT_52878 [Plicaturopsis crispa FD-325 SS-3]
MATLSMNPSSQCDFCHQRPKFGAFAYCGKTCAAQAASLCTVCHQKPKFANHDFCSKNCAAQANNAKGINAPAVGATNTGPARAVAPGVPSKPGVRFAQKPVVPPAPAPQTRQPQQSQAYAQPAPQPQPQAQAPYARPNAQRQAPQQPYQPSQSKNPFLQTGKSNNQPFQPLSQATSYLASAVAAHPAVANIAQAYPGLTSQYGNGTVQYGNTPELDECIIPGCNERVHLDEGSRMSYYCSNSHREEAVALGIAPRCIMCLNLPQGDQDHFCGRACREEALTKPYDE